MVRTLSPERRARFLQSALKLFVDQGVTNTSTAEIASDAGSAAGTLFLYFATKQDLLDELVLSIAQAQSDHINGLLKPTLSARESFAMIWQGTVHWFLENMAAYQYVQQVRDTGMISEAAVEKSGQFFGYYYASIQKGLQEGSIKPYPPELIGAFLYQGIVAVMNLVRAQPEAGLQEELVRQGFEIFWDGIKAVDPGSEVEGR